jgi:hypothetical protein
MGTGTCAFPALDTIDNLKLGIKEKKRWIAMMNFLKLDYCFTGINAQLCQWVCARALLRWKRWGLTGQPMGSLLLWWRSTASTAEPVMPME